MVYWEGSESWRRRQFSPKADVVELGRTRIETAETQSWLDKKVEQSAEKAYKDALLIKTTLQGYRKARKMF